MDDPVAIVSGASGGIGSAIARRLEADGFAVAGCDLATGLDVTDRAAVGHFVARTEAERGPVEVVVTAAGVQRTDAAEHVTEADWRRVLDVNLTGTWNVIQAALPGMLARGRGRVVTISSEIGLAGAAGYAAYAASKG